MIIGFYVLMFILGAVLGSFLCCQARRLHYKHSSKHSKKLPARSICMKCKKQLKWYDNIPVFSWLVLRGKCRFCHTKIGIGEFLSEIGLAAAFVCIATTISFATASPLEWVAFVITLALTICLGFLAIYDGLYGELPSLVLIIAIVIAVVLAVVSHWENLSWQLLLDEALAVAVLGGIYFLLYVVSKGKWVGDGDWLIGTAIAIALGTPWLALFALFIANITACLVMLPTARAKKQIYFGPFLVIAFIVTTTFSVLLESMVI